MKCKANNKNPFAVIDWTKRKNQSKKFKPCLDYNCAFVCNKENNVFCLDLDFYDKYKDGKLIKKFDEDNEKHQLFYKIFGKDFIKKFDTFTQKTPRGGYHLLFQQFHHLH